MVTDENLVRNTFWKENKSPEEFKEKINQLLYKKARGIIETKKKETASTIFKKIK